MPNYAPGKWPVSYAASNCSVFTDESGAPNQAFFEQMAAELLWNWTGRVFSTYDVDVRPCRVIQPEVSPPSSYEGSGPWPINPGFGSGHSTIGFNVGSWMPVLVNGQWFNIRCGNPGCSSESCGCGPDQLVQISLPGPVNQINSVEIDGVTLDPSAYMLRSKRWLVRTDGQAWPTNQDLGQPEGSLNTWNVSFNTGVAVPTGGQIAAGTLACELAKASMGSADCALPQRIQTITREGVTVGILDPFSSTKGMSRNTQEIPKIETGIWSIDAWTAAVTVPRMYAAVHTVDGPGTKGWRY